MQKLRLAGIAWSDNPDAMIENIETNETYFLKQDDLINGKLKIEAIFRNKVILSYQGDQAELQ
jgi:type II secretory pathway component PulC